MLAGSASLAVGLAGILLPVLPTTPFLLLAAACYARVSRRFYSALINNRLCGPSIAQWQRHRSIPRRTKLFALALLALSFSLSIAFVVPEGGLQILMALVGLGLAAFLSLVPTRDHH